MRFLKKVEAVTQPVSLPENAELEHVVAEVAKRCPGKDRFLVRAVAADVLYSGEPEVVLANDTLLERLFAKWVKREETVKDKHAAESADMCPLCRLPTVAIKLDKDRPAKWCARHFVVFPAKVTGDKANK